MQEVVMKEGVGESPVGTMAGRQELWLPPPPCTRGQRLNRGQRRRGGIWVQMGGLLRCGGALDLPRAGRAWWPGWPGMRR